MQPPVESRLMREDYQDAPGWLDKLFFPLNRFMEQTITLFDKNITFGDNIFARQFSTTVTTDAAYATGTFEPISAGNTRHEGNSR